MDASTTNGAPSTDRPTDRPGEGSRIRTLRRSADDRVLGGVAAGIADHYGIDPVLVRLGFVATTFLGGLGAIAYLVGWVALPLAPPAGAAGRRRSDWRQLLGYALVALGLLVIPGRFGFTYHGDGIFWPLALIALGGTVLWLRTRDTDRPDDDRPDPDPPGTDPPGEAAPDPGPGAVALLALPPATREADAEAVADPDRDAGPASDATAVATATSTLQSPVTAPATARVPEPASPRRTRSPLAAVTVSALLVLIGTSWLLDTTGTVDVDLGVVIATALALVGSALLVSAWFGRARRLLVLGIPLLLLVAALGVVDVPLRGGVGDPTYSPQRLADVRRDYELAIGDLTVDLRHVDFAGAHRTVRAQLGIGRLNVVVPPDTRVVVDGHSGVGDVVAFGDGTKQCCPTDVRRVHPGVTGGGTLRVVARVGAGHVEVSTGEDLRATS